MKGVRGVLKWGGGLVQLQGPTAGCKWAQEVEIYVSMIRFFLVRLTSALGPSCSHMFTIGS